MGNSEDMDPKSQTRLVTSHPSSSSRRSSVADLDTQTCESPLYAQPTTTRSPSAAATRSKDGYPRPRRNERCVDVDGLQGMTQAESTGTL